MRLDAAGFPMRPARDNEPPSRFRFTCLVPGAMRASSASRSSCSVSFRPGVDMDLRPATQPEVIRSVKSRDFDAIIIFEVTGRTARLAQHARHSGNTFFDHGYSAADHAFDRMQRARTNDEVRLAISEVMAQSGRSAGHLPRHAAGSPRGRQVDQDSLRDRPGTCSTPSGNCSRASAHPRSRNETHHFTIRDADRDRGGRTAGDLRRAVDQPPAQRHPRVGEPGQRGTRGSGRDPGEACHRQYRPNSAVDRAGARRNVAGAVAAVPSSRTTSSKFPEFHEISLFDAGGRVVATSRVGPPETKVSTVSSHTTQGVEVAPIFLDTDGLPTTDLSIRLKTGPPPPAG